ncbi:DEAD/DEAH box helicase [Alkalibacillus silvisoli]|uniref:ATP-dependent helicase ComFA n=1 Tax=Alkalibacillus silvisoli TaxID=392823 RepID=A0ABN1ABB3_9BACI
MTSSTPPLIEDLARKFATKLLLKGELDLSERRLQYLLDHAYLEKVTSIKSSLNFHQCIRCFNRNQSLFGKIPRQNNTPIIYCKHCIQMNRVSSEEPLYRWVGPPPMRHRVKNPMKWKGELTPLQVKASYEMIKAIQHEAKLLIYAVCGAGKTEMLYAGIEHAIQEGKRVCIATPRSDVVRELAPRLRRDFPTIHSAALYGSSTEKDLNNHLVIATTHQLLRYEDSFDVMVIDEVDAFPYHRDQTLPKAVERAMKQDATKIFLTATPRTKQKVQIALNQLPTVSIPSRYHGHPIPVPTFKSIFRLSKTLENETVPPSINQWIHQKSTSNRRFLLFVPTIELAEKLSAKLTIPHVHAESPDREYKIKQYRARNIEALITTTILERGVTFPSIDVAVIQADHHVFDEAALIQIAGRAGRSAHDPTGDVTFFYEYKTNAMVQARNYTIIKNKEARG